MICVPVGMGDGKWGEGPSDSGAPLRALILLSVKWRHFKGQTSFPQTAPRTGRGGAGWGGGWGNQLVLQEVVYE